MKGKYITKQIMLLRRNRHANGKKDIYAQLEETIAERKRIMQQLEKFSETGRTVEMILQSTQAA
jgi:hypothetical protein